MRTLVSPPKLETLDTKPSWRNRAGRVDRSACFVITAAQHWRRLHPDDWTYRVKTASKVPPDTTATTDPWSHLSLPIHQARASDRVVTRPLPKRLCDRYAERRLWARDLWLLHKWEQPYPLQGDFRSIKTNAMRAHIPRKKTAQRIQSQRDDAILGKGPVNPNRGVGFNHHKMLGLDCMWQTTLRIERYAQHANLKQHFFVCPVCGPRNDGSSGANIPVCRSAKPNRTALGGTSPSANRRGLPHGRVTKLYLPLCTPQEYEDAQVAELWLRTHCHPNRPWPASAVQLIERYSELFEGQLGRQLRCRQCLGLRYGEVKPLQSTKRQRVPQRFSASMPLAHASCSDKSPRLSEQSLFLNNLPKLLAPVPDASAPEGAQLRRPPVCPEPVEGSITMHPSRTVEDLSHADQDKLLLLFAGRLPAFKQLVEVRAAKTE